MKSYSFANATEGLAVMAADLINPGQSGVARPSARGDMYELEDVTVQVPAAKSLPHMRPGTASNKVGLIEGAGLIAGVSTSAQLRRVAPNIDRFTDFWGEYGPRVALQLPAVVSRLHDEPDTRQALITMWTPALDTHGGHNDHPCTIGVSFRVRDGKLNQTVHMRSNDVFLGWSNDVVQFSLLQLTMATVLGLEPGTYTHHSDSMHLYSSNYTHAARFREMRLDDDAWEAYRTSASLKHSVHQLGSLVRPFALHMPVTERWAYAQDSALALLKDFA